VLVETELPLATVAGKISVKSAIAAKLATPARSFDLGDRNSMDRTCSFMGLTLPLGRIQR
jgi:hypothetical protein